MGFNTQLHGKNNDILKHNIQKVLSAPKFSIWHNSESLIDVKICFGRLDDKILVKFTTKSDIL